jgi:hypothetical protein
MMIKMMPSSLQSVVVVVVVLRAAGHGVGAATSVDYRTCFERAFLTGATTIIACC